MEWNELLGILEAHVPAGKITTYGILSDFVFGKRTAGQAIRAMLQAAVNDDFRNSRFTNRVIHSDGRISDVNGQTYQLKAEGFSIESSSVNLSQIQLVKFN